MTPIPEPAALALMAWIAAKGYCGPAPKCAIQLDGASWWCYSQSRRLKSAEPDELVLLRETPEGLIRVVTDGAGRPVEAVLFQNGPCTIVPGEPRGCPSTIPIEEWKARKELQNAALFARGRFARP